MITSANDIYYRPRVLLERFSRTHRDIWKAVDGLRASHRELGGWPDWCYVPLAFGTPARKGSR